ncbi:MAG: hypothetical protein ACJZ86_01435 [Pontiellaceae bacterium]
MKLILVIGLLFGTFSSAANMVSVNFVDANATVANGRAMNAGYHVTGLYGYVATNWINTLDGQNEVLPFEDGTDSSVQINTIRPNGNGYILNNADVYDNTPLRAFLKSWLAVGQESHVELSNLNNNFPFGYSIIVYVSGNNANQGWSVTLNEDVDHTGFDKVAGTTYFGKTFNNPDENWGGFMYEGELYFYYQYVQTDYTVQGLTDESDSALFPTANCVVFTNQTADSILLTVDGMKNNQAGFGGFQIVGNEGTRTVNISSLNGTVTSIPGGTLHEVGSSLSLEAIPANDNYVFAGWSGDLSGDRHTASTNIIVQGNMNIIARFERAYYLSPNGNNGGVGTYQDPWRDLEAIHWYNFSAGEQILFERGGTYFGRASLNVSGTNNAAIIIGAYGAGNLPHLVGDLNYQSLLNLGDSQHIEIEDLHFSNSGSFGALKHKYGINITPSSGIGERNHLWVSRCEFSNIEGYPQPPNSDDNDDYHTSVAIRMLSPNNDSLKSKWNDVRISECVFRNIDGIGFWIKDQSCTLVDYKNSGTSYFPSTSVVFEHNYGTNCYRNLCRVNGTEGALIQFNVHDGTTAGSAFWPFNAKGTLVQYNLFMNLYRDFADAYVCHFDYNCEDTIMQYNVGYKVQGGLVEIICASQYNGTFQTGAIARYNLGVDVGFRDKENSAGILLSGNVDGALVYNNTVITGNEDIYKSISFANFGGQGYPENSSIYNNIFYNIGSSYLDHNALQIGLDGFAGNFRGNELSHNLIFGNSYRSFNAWNGDTVDSNAIYMNPRFLNPTADFEELRGYKPNWSEVVEYVGSRFKINYLSPAKTAGTSVTSNGGMDGFSNIVSSTESPSVGFHEYATDSYVDSDLDLIPDEWEVSYSLDPMLASDAEFDLDEDGRSNLEEFALNGNPVNSLDSGYSVDYSISSANGALVVNQLIPQSDRLQQFGLQIGSYVSTNLVDWEAIGSNTAGIEIDFYDTGVHRITNQLLINQEWPSVFFKMSVE